MQKKKEKNFRQKQNKNITRVQYWVTDDKMIIMLMQIVSKSDLALQKIGLQGLNQKQCNLQTLYQKNHCNPGPNPAVEATWFNSSLLSNEVDF